MSPVPCFFVRCLAPNFPKDVYYALFNSTFLLSHHAGSGKGRSAVSLLPSRLRSPDWPPSCTMELGWGRSRHQALCSLTSCCTLAGRVRWWQTHPCLLLHRCRVGTGKKIWLPKLHQEAMMGSSLRSMNPCGSLDLAPCGVTARPKPSSAPSLSLPASFPPFSHPKQTLVW